MADELEPVTDDGARADTVPGTGEDTSKEEERNMTHHPKNCAG